MVQRQKTPSWRSGETKEKWYVVDASGKTLGRLASRVARIIRGKHKPIFTPHTNCGDHVIVINAEKVQVTGKKRSQKMYYRTSGRPGGLKERTFEELMAKHPTRAIEYAVKGMLPKNRLGREMFKKLKVYAGPEHPHEAQQPEPLEI